MNPTTQPNRRSMLCGLAVALAVPSGLVTACGDSGATSGGTTPTGGGSQPTGGGSTSGGTLVALADVPEGGGAVVDSPSGGKIVIARVSATEVKAFNATCPHQGSLVAEPSGGTITCPSHGSQFGAADGKLKKGPATKGLTEIKVAVSGDQVVLA